MKQGKYGTGVPTMEYAYKSPFGLAERFDGTYVEVETENGPIRMPVGDRQIWNQTFTPTTTLLEVIPFLDTRNHLISDRYFK